MSPPDQEPLPYHTDVRGPRAGSGFLLAMLGLLLAGILLLNTGALEFSYSGYAFMFLFPFAIGGLATDAGLQVYSHYGCILAPVLLFAIIFPLVHYGLAEVARPRTQAFVLTDSFPLRIVTLLLFYLTQGFPIGLFLFALPAWMVSSGVETGAIASVVGAAALPWTIKLVNGFLIDRYTLLAMGRRRIWIIGAQTMLVVSLIVGALIAPLPSDVATIAAIAFAANAAVTFQDVGIDNLAIDIMPEEERARAGGIMAGAQFVGVSLTTASGGWLLAQFGIAVCLLVLAVIPGLVMLFAVVIRERTGEKRLPWSAGRSHPRNEALQVEAWWPLLRSAPRAILAPVSLLLLPILLIRSIP